MKRNTFLISLSLVIGLALLGVGCTKNITYNTYNTYGDTTVIKGDDTTNTQPLQQSTIIETDDPGPEFFNSIYDYSIQYSYRLLITKSDLDSMKLYGNSCEERYYDSEWHTTNCGDWYIISAHKYWGQKLIDGVVYTYISAGKSTYGIGPNALSFGIGTINNLGMGIGQFSNYINYDYDRVPISSIPTIYWIQQ